MSKRIELTDDGTMDTVLRCTECGQEFRGIYDPEWRLHGLDYDAWVEEFIAEIEEEHECEEEL